ncbi:HD domain-containing protein [Candidatus Poribacteria bacterium]|nr:HD domain-containing protein [Candidatus Poribacteria bacterium]
MLAASNKERLMLNKSEIPDLHTLISRRELVYFLDQINVIFPGEISVLDSEGGIIYENGHVKDQTDLDIKPETEFISHPFNITNGSSGSIVVSIDENTQKETLKDNVATLAKMISDKLEQELKSDNLASEIINIYQELNLLYELGELLSSVLDAKEICRIVLDQAVDIINPKSAFVMLIEPDTDELVMTASMGIDNKFKDLRLQMKESIYSKVIRNGSPTVIDDLEKYPELQDKISKDNDLFTIPIMVVPINIKEKVSGIISMSEKENGKKFTTEDTKLITAMASQAGMSLGNARLYEEQREMFLGTVETLAAAVEAKDPYTIGHCRRVAEYAVLIGQELGLPEGEVADLRLAGILHDIGKIGISGLVLKKRGGLSRSEHEKLKNHPVKGAEIIGRMQHMKNIALWIKHHHECYDGSGYPDGLKEEEIPLHSRILALADAYDILTLSRNYNARYPYDIPIVKLHLSSGNQYDPAIVDIFLNLVRENGYKKYLDEYNKNPDKGGMKLNRVAYYRIDSEIINILTQEAQGKALSEDEQQRLQELRKSVLR